MKLNLEKTEATITAFALFALVILVFIAALLRWWGVPVSWAIDMATLLFVWVCFIGGDLAMKLNKHVSVDSLLNTFPQKLRIAITIALYLLMSAFLIVILWFGFTLLSRNFGRRMNTLPISFSWTVLAAPTGSAMMLCTIIKKMRRSIKLFRGKFYDKAEAEFRENVEWDNPERQGGYI
jgi:TRAP-type C4-dicarboxylate transport system permease small subunit